MMRTSSLLPFAALLTLGAAPASAPRELCATATHYCTPLFFYEDSVEIAPAAAPLLDLAIGAIEDNPGASVVVAGYTDAVRSPPATVAMSQRMAQSARDYLVQHGVDPATITTEAYGSANPRVPNTPGKAEPENRRVEIWVMWK